MSKMPELYIDFDRLKADLDNAERVVVYAVPQIADWLVDKEYEPQLHIGEAVKITKWEEEIQVVPVKWQCDSDTSQWYWKELAEPYSRPTD